MSVKGALISLLILSISVLLATAHAYADGGTNPSSSGSIDTSTSSPPEGLPGAPLTMVEFGDYQCPHCDGWFKNSYPAIKSDYIDTGKLKFYFVDIPYEGPDSLPASEATYCAGDQGKYWQYHDMLYENQGPIQSGWAAPASLKQFASRLGLNQTSFNSCLDSGKYSGRVSHNKQIALDDGVQGTPTFFIVDPNGIAARIVGDQPTGVFTGAIDSMYAQAVPEFGPVAAAVLAVALVSITAATARSSLRLSP